jgi:hypothetical protein
MRAAGWLICGRSPSHAHHVRFAQPRRFGLKVGDEFTVSLRIRRSSPCAMGGTGACRGMVCRHARFFRGGYGKNCATVIIVAIGDLRDEVRRN